MPELRQMCLTHEETSQEWVHRVIQRPRLQPGGETMSIYELKEF